MITDKLSRGRSDRRGNQRHNLRGPPSTPTRARPTSALGFPVPTSGRTSRAFRCAPDGDSQPHITNTEPEEARTARSVGAGLLSPTVDRLPLKQSKIQRFGHERDASHPLEDRSLALAIAAGRGRQRRRKRGIVPLAERRPCSCPGGERHHPPSPTRHPHRHLESPHSLDYRMSYLERGCRIFTLGRPKVDNCVRSCYGAAALLPTSPALRFTTSDLQSAMRERT